jgi:hypothetical protein
MRGLQERVGDPVPLFELVLSPAMARRAVPVLGAVTAAGVVVLASRSHDSGALFDGGAHETFARRGSTDRMPGASTRAWAGLGGAVVAAL